MADTVNELLNRQSSIVTDSYEVLYAELILDYHYHLPVPRHSSIDAYLGR